MHTRQVQPMLLFVNRFFHPDHSATSQMLSDLAFRLAGDGMAVRVIASRQRYDDPQADLCASELIQGVHVHRIWSTRFGRAGLAGRMLDYCSFYLSVLTVLLWRTRRGDVIVSKTDPPMLSVLCVLVARLRGAQCINWLQDVFPEVAFELGAARGGGLAAKWLLGIRNWSLRKADMNVVIGWRMLRHLVEAGVPRQRLRRIANWSEEVEPCTHPGPGSGLRDKWIPAGRFAVGYFGNLGRAHDCIAILEAATLLRDDARFIFLMVGGGARMLELRHAADTRQLTNIRFESYLPREQLAEGLACPDVHLLSLLPGLEGLILPSKLYGILAARRSAIFIGDRRGEVARLLAWQDCGDAVQSGDGAALAAMLRVLQADPLLLQGRAVRARQLYEQRYTATIGARRWRDLIIRVASAGAGR